MYLKRHIDAFLRNWKNDPGHLPLIVKGARQVGKTESIRHFAESAYESVVEINFVRDRKFLNITESGYDAASVVRAISRIEPSFSFAPGKTLLFFDEIQANPDIATTLKFFKLDGRFDVICSGSLLGVSYKRIESNSVGYKTDFEMFSMDFEEFLWACGYGDDFVEHLFSHMASSEPFPPSFNEMMFDRFLDYVILGGMPSVVKAYFETGNFSGTLAMQRQIIEDYKEDIVKYTEGLEQARILNVFRHIPVQLGKDNKKFQITKISSNARYKDYWGCIDWLERAGVISVCYCLGVPELPLKGNYDERKYKIYFKDTGLLVAMLDDEVQYDLRANKNLGTYKGALFESIVSEAMAKQGMPLFYYKRENSTLEMDFFGRTVNDLVPIEVKAGNAKAKSLQAMISGKAYEDIRWGIKLQRGNIGFENSIYSFPYYCSFLLKRFLEFKRN
ncbi:MAG: ATP-binding protein [Sutterellaceae bacterium]|nr:ATP-binding protein [Sutterellaceae bacterium]MDY2868093.1 ATP-binding protein [Mesosutterella sp.]